jgi:hypothetical protein
MIEVQKTTATEVYGAALDEATVLELRASLRGPLLLPSDAGYEEARQVWNGLIDRRPALIARCAGAADVINAVNFARAFNVLVSVRGGGHNVAGNAVCDGGLMIDLSLMKGIHVDPKARTARAQGGATWGDLGRSGPGDAGLWPGYTGWCRLHHRNRRADAGGWVRLAARQVRLRSAPWRELQLNGYPRREPSHLPDPDKRLGWPPSLRPRGPG